MVIPKKTNFPRFKSGVQHFPREGPGGWSNFFEVVAGGGGGGPIGNTYRTPFFLSFFLSLRLNPLGDIRRVFENTKF